MTEIIKQVVPVILGIIGGYALAWFTGVKALKKGVQVLLRAKLRQDRNYFEKAGITYEQKADYEAMYLAYHDMGKNGVMTECYKAVMRMRPKGADYGKS